MAFTGYINYSEKWADEWMEWKKWQTLDRNKEEQSGDLMFSVCPTWFTFQT